MLWPDADKQWREDGVWYATMFVGDRPCKPSDTSRKGLRSVDYTPPRGGVTIPQAVVNLWGGQQISLETRNMDRTMPPLRAVGRPASTGGAPL